MATSISARSLVDLVLLGPAADRRQLQDSPVLGDVWAAYAEKPGKAQELLITPHMAWSAGHVATLVAERVGESDNAGVDPMIAYLQGLVAAHLTFEVLLRYIVPLTTWWQENVDKKELAQLKKGSDALLKPVVSAIQSYVLTEKDGDQDRAGEYGRILKFSSLERYLAMAGIILWVSGKKAEKGSNIDLLKEFTELKDTAEITAPLSAMFKDMSVKPELSKMHGPASEGEEPTRYPIYLVALNRKAMAALERSVAAVKADASKTLFKVKCDKIRWAVLDSGIDGSHEAFLCEDGKTVRIKAAYDFGFIRKIVCVDNGRQNTSRFAARFEQLAGLSPFAKQNPAEAKVCLKILAEDAASHRPVHWELVEKFIAIDIKTEPKGGHGTHVAGIIGARGQVVASGQKPSWFDGMCPDIWLYDFRVLGDTIADSEFAIIAALQYIRHLNDRSGFIQVHGANLSLSIPHDVRNYACGRTPICNECERLIDSGVVVVAAAGNQGHHSFETGNGVYDGYMAFSITDPGNADAVITVGATHRFWPHTYGVSFFSSRGPTGDGRIKPDLVAPGERIFSCLPNKGAGALDGTSMAAPHVSGAAAMLMARYSEMIGQPRKIKEILCQSATDLNRERSFQGHGMLDVLRAFQRI